MATDINFKNIIARGGSQTRSFEELCTQLAKKTISDADRFERYHGDGGDGGVECIARSTDGSVTGWQSKFVTNVDDLMKQASLSLETAIKIHPGLKKYVVCFPFDLTGQTGRTTKKGVPAKSGSSKLNDWVKNSIARYKAEGVALETIELWPANQITALLLQHDTFSGMRSYFFSDTFISEKWFKKNIDTAIIKAGPRYSPELSVQTDVWDSFAAFGQTETWDTIIQHNLDKVTKKLKEFASNINKQSNDPVFPGFPKQFTAQATDILEGTNSVLLMLGDKPTNKTLTSSEEQLAKVITLLVVLEQELVNELNKQNPGEQWDNKRWRTFMSEYMVSFPAANLDKTRETLDTLRSLMKFVQSPNFKLASEKVFVLSGIGGSGKTHCICDVAQQRLDTNQLSCIAFGDQFTGNPNEWTRFGETIGIRGAGNDQLLDTLNSAGEQSGKPLIIFLDAINETIPRNYWTNKIVAFADEIAKRPFLKLCISCRSSFLTACLPDSHPFILIEHSGFKGFEREACNAFFTFYELNPPLIPILQPELSNPLYLKLVCTTLKLKRLKDLPPGWAGLLPVIKAFLHEKEKQLCQKYDLSPNGSLVVTALTSIIQEIVNKAEASLSWNDATTAIAKNSPPITTHQLLDWLVEADLLIEDGSINEDELDSQTYVRPAFERLGDFLLATEIAKQAVAGDLILSHQKMKDIFKNKGSIDSNASLVAALSVILPENHTIELPSLFKGEVYKQVAAISTSALIWRTPDSLTEKTREFVQDSLSKDGYTGMDALFSICTNVSMLDALWISKFMEDTLLPHRDAFLTGYLYTRYNENGIIRRLTEAHHDLDISSLKIEVAYRWLLVLIWMTASPDRRVKDNATRAAIAILKHHNQLGVELLNNLMFINDEEVVERLLLIIYAAQILNPDKISLGQVSTLAVTNYLSQPETFQNALIRDHIRCIAELAKYLGCLPETIEPLVSNQTRLSEGWTLPIPDEDLVNEWKEERGARRLALDSALTDDFNHYSINCLSAWMKNLSKAAIGKWIINDVIERKGLNDEIHDAYDITIFQETGGGRSKPAYAERLGKKYQWNALYRLASILHDNVAKKDRYSEPEPIMQPLILQEERRLDPTLTQPYLTFSNQSKNWWIMQKPDLSTTESLTPDTWLDFQADVPPLQNIISVTQFDNQGWIPISGQLSFDTSQKNDEWGQSYRLLDMSIDAFLVKNKDLESMIKRLNGKNLNNDSLPSGGNFSHCYLGEYPWATACNTEPDWYLGVGDTFGDTSTEMHPATNEIVTEWEYDATLLERNLYLQVPSKKFFEPGDLWWNGKDGYKRLDGKTVFREPRIETGGKKGLVADFQDMVERLKKINYNIIWVLRGHKYLINYKLSRDRKYISQIAWMDDTGKLAFGKRVFFKSFDSKRGTPDKM